MNEYHDHGESPWDSRGQEVLDKWILTPTVRYIPSTDEIEEMTQGLYNFRQRSHFTVRACWFLPTREWVEHMLKIVEGKKVLELAAGTGFAGAIFRLHGVDWTSTDIDPARSEGRPWSEVNPVLQLNWQEAVSLIPHDVIFISWWPYNEKEGTDLKIARWALANGKRVIFVGEGYGGCTGSADFWRYAKTKNLLPLDEDVAQWVGIRDQTYELTGLEEKPRRSWFDDLDNDAEDE